MPHSLVLNLVPLSLISPGYLSGKHIHALFLNLVSYVSRELGDRLHEEKSEKSFTLSPLQIAGAGNSRNGKIHILQWEHQQPIPAGTPCWLRVSLLDDAIFGNLTKLWLNLNPAKPWHLGSADLKITSILGTPQSSQLWANFATYQQLYDRASEVDREISLTFCTPTTFRQQQYDSALPTKDSVFGSLINRWNKYSHVEFSPDLIQPIFPSYFEIKTSIATDKRSKFIGCIGNISYRIFGEVEPLVIKQINALADFALYSGVGRKTPMGMGMVRRLSSNK
jgi:CRISPR-associated endoribonuclease Cas6